VHHAAYANTSDLFVAELLFLNAGTIVERRLGSLKYAVWSSRLLLTPNG
jgi:hypothetical protein